MSEKKFLVCVLIEGIILTVLGLCILIIPKLTSLTFGVMLSAAFIAYGVYKIVKSIIYRNANNNSFLCLLMGVFLTVIGILLLFVPKVSLLWLIALTGVYFLLESLLTTGFMAQIRKMFSFWLCKIFTVAALFFVGLIIIIGLPLMSFWVVSVLCGLAFLVKGMSKVSLYLTNRDNY